MESSEGHTEKEIAKPKSSLKAVVLIQLFVITTIIITVVFTYQGAFPFDSELGIYKILPGDILFDFIWLYVISIVLGLVLYFIGPMFREQLLIL